MICKKSYHYYKYLRFLYLKLTKLLVNIISNYLIYY